MPATLEAALILIVLIAPGFISTQVKNRLVPYRTPSAFEETVQAVILSAFMFPLWLLGGYLLRARDQLLMAWQHPVPLPWWAVVIPILAICLIYLVVAPLLGIAYALLLIKRPYAAVGHWLLTRLGITTRYEEGPEVWDQVFGRREVRPWVRVWFKDGTAIEGVVSAAGVSPASKQVYLSGIEGVPNSLVRLDAEGAIVEDLSGGQAEGVWIEVGSEVRRVEVFS